MHPLSSALPADFEPVLVRPSALTTQLYSYASPSGRTSHYLSISMEQSL